MQITKGGNLLFLINEKYHQQCTEGKLISLSLMSNWILEEMDKLDPRSCIEKCFTAEYEHAAAQYKNFKPATYKIAGQDLIFICNKN